MSEQLFISEIFKSVQGEGSKIGTPSVFLRLGICNLQCVWCDTPYTWKKGLTDYKARGFDWVLRKIASLTRGSGVGNIVVTGGEPLLQQAQLAELLSFKLFDDMEIEFETNGSMPLLPAMKSFIKGRRVTFTISPKLADSGNKPYKVHLYPNSVLKFVYVSKKSEKLIDDFIKNSGVDTLRTKVYIMPEGTSVEAMSQKYKDLLKYCEKRGYHFTPRLQIYLFGNTRAT
ncbi:7-carboxy-7-deazaguanine synthase QueE [Candidatus Peregrinibacteria bacterium]|nr:7-carboxy-7-deazaguanine synthase QueE [Candidatus Peregrinibacteria bacterium]